MNKHTPAPWNNLPRTEYVPICRPDEAGLSIGFLHSSDPARQAEGLANSFLISAAPDLLEALENFVNDIVPNNPNEKLWAEARAAIAKAKGE